MTAITARKPRAATTPRGDHRPPHKAPQHRPSSQAHSRDSLKGLDMFSGCGGSSQGIELAGIDVWYAANHWEYAVELHEANHPKAEHFVADLLDKEAPDYYHPELLPRADFLWASPSCTNHSQSNSQRAYEQNLNLFDSVLDDPDYDAMVTESEKSRATAVCVLQYARYHRPLAIAVENVVQFAGWGKRRGTSKTGNGTTFDWWLNELHKLGYKTRVLYLNSMFFGVPQSRDRMYICAWQECLGPPDLDFTPDAWCSHCDQDVPARQTFKRPTKAWPRGEWGKYRDQYVYTCPSCRRIVEPYRAAAIDAIDLSNLGRLIGDALDDLAAATLQRLSLGVEQYFGRDRRDPFVMPCKSKHGVDRSVLEPLPTQTTQQEMMLVQSAFQAVLAGNTFQRDGSSCRVRGLDEPMPTQHTTQSHGVVMHPALVDNFQGVPRPIDEPMPTQTGSETMGVIQHPLFLVKNNGGADPACRSYPASEPLGTVVGSSNHQGLVVHPMLHTARGSDRPAPLAPLSDPMTTVTAGGNHHYLISAAIQSKLNGAPGDTAWHPVDVDPFGTLMPVDTTCLVTPPTELWTPRVEECYYRMLTPNEIRTGMGFAPTFKMWGSARNRVRALGNAVTPPVATWITERLLATLRGTFTPSPTRTTRTQATTDAQTLPLAEAA